MHNIRRIRHEPLIGRVRCVLLEVKEAVSRDVLASGWSTDRRNVPRIVRSTSVMEASVAASSGASRRNLMQPPFS